MCGGEDCIEIWRGAEHHQRVDALDRAHPDCGCEQHSLAGPPRTAVANDDLVARIVIAPEDWNETRTYLGVRLIQAYRNGFSLIRQGASEDEIVRAANNLLDGEDNPTLVGVSVVPASSIRELGVHWFCVYDTEQGDYQHHAEIAGTADRTWSNSQAEKQKGVRRKALRQLLNDNIIEADTVEDLVIKLRAVGFSAR